MLSTQEFKRQSLTYILGAFGLIVGLAWNDAIKALIDYLYPLEKDGLPAKFIYALGMTILVIIITAIVTKFTQEKK